jgi:hypothetical protein
MWRFDLSSNEEEHLDKLQGDNKGENMGEEQAEDQTNDTEIHMWRMLQNLGTNKVFDCNTEMISLTMTNVLEEIKQVQEDIIGKIVDSDDTLELDLKRDRLERSQRRLLNRVVAYPKSDDMSGWYDLEEVTKLAYQTQSCVVRSLENDQKKIRRRFTEEISKLIDLNKDTTSHQLQKKIVLLQSQLKNNSNISAQIQLLELGERCFRVYEKLVCQKICFYQLHTCCIEKRLVSEKIEVDRLSEKLKVISGIRIQTDEDDYTT